MLCLFEDDHVRNFLPVAATRHLSHLLSGTMTLRERAVKATGDTAVVLHGRGFIRAYHRAAGEHVDRPAVATLFVNARVPLASALVAEFPDGEEWIATHGGETIAARLEERSIAKLDWDADALDFTGLSMVERHEIAIEPGAVYEYLWDLIYDNGERIADDFAGGVYEQEGLVMSGAHLINPSQISIGAGSVIKPGAVIDASAGPVVIGDDVEVMPMAAIEGPCSIGHDSRVKIGAKIYGQTSIGPWCKVGGEIEGSIILGYSNKQHDGFLGHSYLGRWVNLGADTNTSDLKNNYGTVRLAIAGRQINTGRIFVGSLIGDHVKTAINTMLNTGTVIGAGANVFGAGFPPKSIPAFAWGGFEGGERYRLDQAIEVAARVMGRRKVPMTSADETLLRYLYDHPTEAS
jgi:UDP-N-acetylglucosamine diphosphorylase/glucosamine-1-phosphate N-acetyltransferase